MSGVISVMKDVSGTLRFPFSCGDAIWPTAIRSNHHEEAESLILFVANCS